MANEQEQFRVLFRGKVASNFTQEQVAATLGKMLGKPPASLAPLFEGQQKISFSKHPIDFQKAVKTKIKLLRLGLVTDIEPYSDKENVEPATTSNDHRQPPAANDETPFHEENSHNAGAKRPDTAEGPTSVDTNKSSKNHSQNTDLDNADKQPDTLQNLQPNSEDLSKPVLDQNAGTLEQLDAPPAPDTIVHSEGTSAKLPDDSFEATTAETLIHDHKYTYPTWKRLFSIPTLIAVVVVIGLLGTWVYKKTSFIPSPASQVIENHLATEDLSLIGLISLSKLDETESWISTDVSRFKLPEDLALFKSMGINLKKDVNDIIVSQHARNGSFPTALILLGKFNEEKLRSVLMTQFDAEPVEDNKHQLSFVNSNDSGCRNELTINLDSKEIILTSSDFMPELYDLIHKNFESKPARLKEWRQYRKHDPVSFAILNASSLSRQASDLLKQFHGKLDLADVQTIYMGLNISRILIDNAIINSTIVSADQAELEATRDALKDSTRFSDIRSLELTPGKLEVDIPLNNKNANLGLFHEHSLLGLCK